MRVHFRQTPAARKPVAAAAAKDDSFFGAFQGLSLDGLMGGTNAAPVAPPSVGGDQCKVMWEEAFKDTEDCWRDSTGRRQKDQGGASVPKDADIGLLT